MIDIAKIIKNSPKGTNLYSPICGDCTFTSVSLEKDADIIVTDGQHSYRFNRFGQYLAPNINSVACKGECLLFPSKEYQDWYAYTPPHPCYNFKPFDKVIVRNGHGYTWNVSFYGYYSADEAYPYKCGVLAGKNVFLIMKKQLN